MSKLKHEEIKKSLECCRKQECQDCAYRIYSDDDNCFRVLMKESIDLINQYEAEIESLNNQERILICQLAEEREKAIRDFAERLKANITINNTDDGFLLYSVDYTCLMDEIDNLAEEMVGEGNEPRKID